MNKEEESSDGQKIGIRKGKTRRYFYNVVLQHKIFHLFQCLYK